VRKLRAGGRAPPAAGRLPAGLPCTHPLYTPGYTPPERCGSSEAAPQRSCAAARLRCAAASKTTLPPWENTVFSFPMRPCENTTLKAWYSTMH